MIAIDTETTGLDLNHSCRPFLVTTCDENGEQLFWEWDVNPLDRSVNVPEEDVIAIQTLLRESEGVVGHNQKFDAKALESIGIVWDWSKAEDTILMAHLLGSNRPKNLTDLAIYWLQHDISPYEDRLHVACVEARKIARREFKDWRIAKAGMPDLPSAKEETWKYDTWLPRVVAERMEYPPEHPWWTVLQEYANTDSSITAALFPVLSRELAAQRLDKLYGVRKRMLAVTHRMEKNGVTVSKVQLDKLRVEFTEESERCGNICRNIAAGYGYDLELPKSGMNKSLQGFCFGWTGLVCQTCGAEEETSDWSDDRSARESEPVCEQCLKKGKIGRVIFQKKRWADFPVVHRTEKRGEPSLDAKIAIPTYLATLNQRSKQYLFVKSLADQRRRNTALGYIDSYEKFWLPHPMGLEGWHVLYPSYNATGTDTLRFSSQNPNAQQISKQEDINLRRLFGPAPGRVWYPCDYENIELRVPGIESGEPAMVELFEKPDKPPYFGSYHLLNASIIYPREFNQLVCPVCLGKGCEGKSCRPAVPLCSINGGFKSRYKATQYQWVKNAGFALIYGCQEAKFDQTAKKPGAYRLLRSKLSKLFALSDKYIQFANKYGYVETLPDKTLGGRGYPLLCTRSEWGKILPTVPLNYHVQGTAMYATIKAMIRCQDQLDEWKRAEGFDGQIVLQVHDELVFSMSSDDLEGNKVRVERLKKLMEQSGDDIGVPLKVSTGCCPNNWGKEE